MQNFPPPDESMKSRESEADSAGDGTDQAASGAGQRGQGADAAPSQFLRQPGKAGHAGDVLQAQPQAGAGQAASRLHFEQRAVHHAADRALSARSRCAPPTESKDR